MQVIAPYVLAFIGINTDRNIIMGDSKSKSIVQPSSESKFFYHKSTLRTPNMSYTKYARAYLNRCIPRGSPLQSSLSAPQQNVDQEWNNGRQIIVTDLVMIMQSLSYECVHRKCVKT